VVSVKPVTNVWGAVKVGMPGESSVKKVFKNIPEGKISVGKPRKRWLASVENDPKKIGVKRLDKNS
jgi:hypothetical protein